MFFIPPSLLRSMSIRELRNICIILIVGMLIALAFMWAGMLAAISETEKYDEERAERLAACNVHPWPKPAHCAEFWLEKPAKVED